MYSKDCPHSIDNSLTGMVKKQHIVVDKARIDRNIGSVRNSTHTYLVIGFQIVLPTLDHATVILSEDDPCPHCFGAKETTTLWNSIFQNGVKHDCQKLCTMCIRFSITTYPLHRIWRRNGNSLTHTLTLCTMLFVRTSKNFGEQFELSFPSRTRVLNVLSIVCQMVIFLSAFVP